MFGPENVNNPDNNTLSNHVIMSPNVLLINPGVNSLSQSQVVNRVINKTFPTSLGILAGCVNASGLGRAEIWDEQVTPITPENLAARLARLESPKLVGLSVLTMNYCRAKEIAAMVRRLGPEATVVFGGIHPTVRPEESLLSGGAHIVVRGEGEFTVLEILEALDKGGDICEITGLSFRSNGEIVHTPDRPLLMDLDQLPRFPYELFRESQHHYDSFGGVFTSRGCPHRCIFCSSRSISGKRYRYFSIERVLSEIKVLVDEFGQDQIWLMDDNIAVNRKRFMNLCDAIQAEGLHEKACFHGSMRGDNATPEVLAKAKETNFMMIAFGLETGSERLMKLIDKGETVAQVAAAVCMTDQAGLVAATTIIFGLPTETKEDRKAALKLVKSLPLGSVRFNTLTPYPGTPAFKRLEPEGKVLVKKDWLNFGVQYMWEGDDIPYVPEGTGRYELMLTTMYANLSYYLSYRGLSNMLRSSFAGGNVVKLEKLWFFSPKMLFRLSQLGMKLIIRFLEISVKRIREKLPA